MDANVKSAWKEARVVQPVNKAVYASENDDLTLSITDFALSLGWHSELTKLWVDGNRR
jgi:hypothetical protein